MGGRGEGGDGGGGVNLVDVLREANRIRGRLLDVADPNNDDLAGFCAQASILLAGALGDVTSLRASVDHFGTGHYWNVVHGCIVDITASQFEDKLRDVLVTERPQRYHRPLTSRGLAAFVTVLEEPEWIAEPGMPEFSEAVRKLCTKRKIEIPARFRLQSATPVLTV